MSTISDPRAPIFPGPCRERLLTAADLVFLPSELPSGPVHYELDNGRLVLMAPPGDEHGSVEANFTGELRSQGQKRNLGKVRCGEVGIVLWRNPDRVVGADAVFIANSSLPLRLSPEGYLETIPDLVVEVMSKNDTWTSIKKKVEDYQKAGVRVVWVADPAQRTVTACRRDRETTFTEKEILSVEDIIPGFRLAVAEVFKE